MGRRRAALTAALALLVALGAALAVLPTPPSHTTVTTTPSRARSPPPPRTRPPTARTVRCAATRPCPRASPTWRRSATLSEATAVAFAPDGTAFVALKTGVIKSFDYNAGTGEFEPLATATNFADLTANVNNYWDRGLTGIALDPQFGTAGHNFVYVNYTYNRDPRDDPPVVPKWGDPGQQYDECPARPRRRTRRTRRLRRDDAGHPAHRGARTPAAGMMPARSSELLASGCFQFGSHASGDVAFGPDGLLYASAGDGASFDTLDYGQYANPCARPGDEGGSLRVAGLPDVRATRSASAARSSGSTRRPGSPRPQATANSWLVAYGQRNPWRLTFRPGTNELWSGDVGGSEWEEVNRIPDVTPGGRARSTAAGPATRAATPARWCSRAGTPSTSRSARTSTRRALSAVTAPYFSYQTRGAAADARARTARTTPRRSPASRSARRPATTRRRTRARCSSPTSPAPASGCSARSRTATPTRPSSSRSCRTPRRRWTW